MAFGAPRAITTQVILFSSGQYGNVVRRSFTAPLTVTLTCCFNCGATDHLVRACPINLGCARVCYSCGGVEHFSHVCPSRSNQSSRSKYAAACPVTSSSNNSSSVNAIASASKGPPQSFSPVSLDGFAIQQTLIDTLAVFSIVPVATLRMIHTYPKFYNFDEETP